MIIVELRRDGASRADTSEGNEQIRSEQIGVKAGGENKAGQSRLIKLGWIVYGGRSKNNIAY